MLLQNKAPVPQISAGGEAGGDVFVSSSPARPKGLNEPFWKNVEHMIAHTNYVARKGDVVNYQGKDIPVVVSDVRHPERGTSVGDLEYEIRVPAKKIRGDGKIEPEENPPWMALQVTRVKEGEKAEVMSTMMIHRDRSIDIKCKPEYLEKALASIDPKDRAQFKGPIDGMMVLSVSEFEQLDQATQARLNNIVERASFHIR